MISRALVLSRIKHWRKKLRISPRYVITFVIHPLSNQMPEEFQGLEACIEVDQAYFGARIEINGQLVNENNLDEILIHELLHILTEPLATFASMAVPEKYKEQVRVFNESLIENLIPAILEE